MRTFAKEVIAALLRCVGWVGRGERRRDISYGRYIRMVAYHDTPPERRDGLERQFAYLAEHYRPATWHQLVGVLNGEPWNGDKPGIMISFDDGIASNFEVAAPLLDKYGLTGIFLVPTDFPDTPESEQPEWARKATLECRVPRAISWERLRDLIRRGHKVVSHTRSHLCFGPDTPQSVIDEEIFGSRKRIVEQLGECDVFGWPRGLTEVYQPAVYRSIIEAGYQYVLSTIPGPNDCSTHRHMIRRTVLFPSWSISLVRLVLLPWYDKSYLEKERIIRKQMEMP